ncbi:MAG: hypothetical protein AAGJ35_15540, partial [Myxococcota bacterium]
MIDDYTICGVNATVGLPERLRVESVKDLTAAFLVGMDRAPNGASPLQIGGKTYDLKSAYKQFGVSEQCVKKMKVALKHPQGHPVFYDVLALPFGATASVSAFLRLSASVAFIGVQALKLCWTVFFDDFSAVAPKSSCSEVCFFIESLFRLLGLLYADEGEKALDFSERFKTLGVQLDLSNWSSGSFDIGHTEKRTMELLALIQQTLDDGRANPESLESLHGKLVWFRSFIFGRHLQRAVKCIAKFSRMPGGISPLPIELQQALRYLGKQLQDAKPKKVVKPPSCVWHVYTDGAFEPSNQAPASIGGVLVNDQGQAV